MLLAAATVVAAPKRREYTIKVAQIWHFANYTTWSKTAKKDSPFVFGVIGKDPYGSILDVLTKRRFRGRKIVVRRIKNLKAARGCDVLIVSNSVSRAPLLKALKKLPILTVGESSGFADAGGVIGFVIVSGRVRFDINKDAAKAAGLRLDPKLLRAARRRISKEDEKKKKAKEKKKQKKKD